MQGPRTIRNCPLPPVFLPMLRHTWYRETQNHNTWANNTSRQPQFPQLHARARINSNKQLQSLHTHVHTPQPIDKSRTNAHSTFTPLETVICQPFHQTVSKLHTERLRYGPSKDSSIYGKITNRTLQSSRYVVYQAASAASRGGTASYTV